MTEKALEQKLVKAVRDVGGIAYKFTSPGHSGVPDRLVVLPARIIFVEVKKPGYGKLSKLQLKEKEKLESLEAEYYVLDELEQIEKILNGVHTS